MSRSDAITAISAHLSGYGSGYFNQVKGARPNALAPVDKLCIFYTEGEGELPEAYRNGTLTRAMVAERWVIKAFWQKSASPEKQEGRILEQWDARRGIATLLRGDSQLGGNVDDLKIRSVTQDIEPYGENGTEWEVMTITFDTWDLNAEAIAK